MHAIARRSLAWTCILAVATWAAAWAPRDVRAADRLPANTDSIESLTPDQARTLLARARADRDNFRLNGGMASGRRWNGLSLNGLKTLDGETATVLAEFKGLALSLKGLTTLSPEAAAAIAGFQGESLVLHGLTTLPVDVARPLARSPAWDGILPRLATLSPEAAAALAEVGRDRLVLSGLAELTPETARAVAAFAGGNLGLSGPTSLSPAVAEQLAEARCAWLTLDGLTEIPPDVARALAAFRGPSLSLNGLQSLPAESAAPLAAFKGNGLSLNRLPTLSPQAAAALAAYAGEGLIMAAAMSKLGGDLALTPETARLACTCARRSGIVLPGITTFDTPGGVESATILATITRPLALPALKAISADALRAVAGSRSEALNLSGLATLDAEAARALATFAGGTLMLNGVKALRPEVCRELAAFQGRALRLDSLLPTIGRDVPLTPEVARLVHHCGQEPLPGLMAGPGITLAGVGALDMREAEQIAKILATVKGPLSLPSLKKISPKTLSALIRKEDVTIPLIETLELIPEPDGSATEDVVVPPEFENRQDKQRREQRQLQKPSPPATRGSRE